jgi:hypothetical protein
MGFQLVDHLVDNSEIYLGSLMVVKTDLCLVVQKEKSKEVS